MLTDNEGNCFNNSEVVLLINQYLTFLFFLNTLKILNDSISSYCTNDCRSGVMSKLKVDAKSILSVGVIFFSNNFIWLKY